MERKVKELCRRLGILEVAIRIRTLISAPISHKKWKALSESNCIMLELGSGAKKGNNGWTTVDLYGADISHDLKKGIPLPDRSVDRIYTSHMLEHIPYSSLIKFINECYRVLKDNGELSVAVPNAGFYITAYIERRQFLTSDRVYEPAFVDTGSYLDQVNYMAYMDGQHHYMFDEENLINTLNKTPFSSVSLRKFDPALDLKSRDFESIYACAVK